MIRKTSRRFNLSSCLVISLLMVMAGWLVVRTAGAKTTPRQQPGLSLIRKSPATIQARRRLFHAHAQQQGATGEHTIEQGEKNIKVFNGLPQSQLIPMMNFMAASLGVRCNYCHVNKGGVWDYAADEKQEKNTAREMITMVFALNKANFKGNPQVSCFTCHHGRSTPQGVPALPLPEPPTRGGVGPGPVGATTPGAAAPAPPTADDILNKYVTAIGGQAAIDKLKTRVMKGNLATSNGLTATYQIDQSGDKFHLTFTAPQFTIERGFDGTTGWEKNSREVSVIAGEQLGALKHSSSLFIDLKLKAQFTRMNLRKEKLDGRDVWVINAINTERKRERLYFDAESGLLLRRASGTQTPIGLMPVEVNYDDYRDVDGVKVPFTIKVTSIEPGSPTTLKYTEIKSNAPVDDAVFNKPPALPPPPPRP